MTFEQISDAITDLNATTQARAFLLGLLAAATRKDREVLAFYDAQLCKPDNLVDAGQKAAMSSTEYTKMIGRVETLQAAILDYAGREGVQTFGNLAVGATFRRSSEGTTEFEKVGRNRARRIIAGGLVTPRALGPRSELLSDDSPVFHVS